MENQSNKKIVQNTPFPLGFLPFRIAFSSFINMCFLLNKYLSFNFSKSFSSNQ